MTMGNEVWMDGARYAHLDGRNHSRLGEARVHILTHTLHYGLGLFEGIRCYKTPRGPAIFRLPEHVSRLFEGRRSLACSSPSAKSKSPRPSNRRCMKTPWRSVTSGLWSMSAMASWGLTHRGSRFASPSRPGPGGISGRRGLASGIRVRISSFTRHHPNIMMTKAKVVGNYAILHSWPRSKPCRPGMTRHCCSTPRAMWLRAPGKRLHRPAWRVEDATLMSILEHHARLGG